METEVGGAGVTVPETHRLPIGVVHERSGWHRRRGGQLAPTGTAHAAREVSVPVRSMCFEGTGRGGAVTGGALMTTQ